MPVESLAVAWGVFLFGHPPRGRPWNRCLVSYAGEFGR